ncbi:hypothetical protein BP5796_12925 [Coleophoma crateriformis]|uniref:Uncharacterized protein n=1 Tax=Coleophoma crateriformis TaxID=565419 RepID=A0A3D8Q5D2_9HELO|nr:hypothetical protein BP5796_12925 [Coleophoma crateriformis]
MSLRPPKRRPRSFSLHSGQYLGHNPTTQGRPKRGEILQGIISKVQGEQAAYKEHVEYAIDLTVRLWLMVHINHARRGITGLTPMPWPGGSLNSALTAHFRHELILTNSIKLERIFHACNIERIADVRIRWTSNLVDHLRFIEDGKRPILDIFHHTAFLCHHKTNPVFPPGLISETLQTVVLLFMHNPACKKWYLAQHARHSLDPLAITCGQLKLEERQVAHFKYWHDRLVIIKQYFDESEPRTIKQWWYDDRKRVQWFWVAIVLVVCTILFGIIQCFEGGWQIWKAYHP